MPRRDGEVVSGVILRRTAARIRDDVDSGQAHGDGTFLLAVADWLDQIANLHEYGSTGPRDMEIALTAARAYMGEAAS